MDRHSSAFEEKSIAGGAGDGADRVAARHASFGEMPTHEARRARDQEMLSHRPDGFKRPALPARACCGGRRQRGASAGIANTSLTARLRRSPAAQLRGKRDTNIDRNAPGGFCRGIFETSWLPGDSPG